MSQVLQLFRNEGNVELCFNIGTKRTLTKKELKRLRYVLAEGFIIDSVYDVSSLDGDVVEIGPRPGIETPWSTKAVSICRGVDLGIIERIEVSERHLLPEDMTVEEFFAVHGDRATQEIYSEQLRAFATGEEPEEVYDVDLIGGGPDELLKYPEISMDASDRQMYFDHFAIRENRNPTIAEIMDLNNANSDHSRHGTFNAQLIIDGKEQKETLFDLVKGALEVNPHASVIGFHDNASAIEGHTFKTLIPVQPGKCSELVPQSVTYDITLTAETHNFPTGVAPFPGAATGTGGRIRDGQGVGKGGFPGAGTTGYCVGNLLIPGYELPWEGETKYSQDLASALKIEIDASNGASDYGNKYGEPVILGFTRSFDLRIPDGDRLAFMKPIMFTGGLGQMDSVHRDKADALAGMAIVQVGGPAHRIGFGGGASSSKLQGEQSAELDFNAVQRGDPEMAQKVNRVVRALNEMGVHTLSQIIHDQGAAGIANVLKELVEKVGGYINIRRVNVADASMSVLEIYVCEFQERIGYVVMQCDLAQMQEICEREKVALEVLGEVTGNLRFVVRDEWDDSTPVDIDLPALLGDLPQKTITDHRVDLVLQPLVLPEGLTVRDALERVLRLLSVGSKSFLTNKVDRSVTGRVAQQQCVGALQLPLSNAAVMAHSLYDLVGAATSIGEQPMKMVVDPASGAEMAIGEALLNIVWAGGLNIQHLKYSGNWMAAPKLEGEAAAVWDACTAMCAVSECLGIAPDGGKDSFSMATILGDEVVKSPRELVISLYGAMPDITKVITPDIKKPGESILLYINASSRAREGRKTRLGGSALAQVYEQFGDESPRMDEPYYLRSVFMAVQDLIDKDLILAGHDVSDGGLITTLLEMAFAGNCGFNVFLDKVDGVSAMEALFAEELGVVIECDVDDLQEVRDVLDTFGISDVSPFGDTRNDMRVRVWHGRENVLNEDIRDLRHTWEETSYRLELLQTDPVCVNSEMEVKFDRCGPMYHVPYPLIDVTFADDHQVYRPKVAILREEGCNSDREMSAAFEQAGFEVWDVTMTDLLAKRTNLSFFRGLVAVGGFSYADVLGSAKGWAAMIRFHSDLRAQFDAFYEREDTFSFGVCNGCQLFALLGWVPWRGIADDQQPRFIQNDSGRFESRWSTVEVQESNAIMLKGMEGLRFGIPVAHGEGKFNIPDPKVRLEIRAKRLTPIVFVDDDGEPTEVYPFNPNGSPDGSTSLCSEDGRHLAMMPHPERAFRGWQCQYLPEGIDPKGPSPWMQMFHNAYDWCIEN